MDWREFLRAWSTVSRRRPPRQVKEETVNVLDWVEFFGLGKDSLD